MIKHFLNPPNWFTSASMFCGLYSILLATGVDTGEPNFYRAAWMLVFAGVFDMLDGRVARLTGTGSDFGVQLDSLADIVSFGVAPAILVYAWGLSDLGIVGLGTAFFFFLCGAFRLARFNMSADGTKHSHSDGLTITMAGGTVASLVMAHAANDMGGVEHVRSVVVITIGLGLLMVSRLRFFSWSALRLRPAHMIGVALGIALVLVVSMHFRWASAFLAIATIYLGVGLTENLVSLFRRGGQVDIDDGLDDGLGDGLDDGQQDADTELAPIPVNSRR
ncbi:MAG: CDP-diacylglycerol--serine O-phosphatidyltransferase [Oligoflexia bacterium]|nr:CDP-diacylglycerol--serine O-phosphatidyltransferase [Oligoflexia bacterium]